MTAIVVKKPKQNKKAKTLKERIEDILLSGNYTDYADVVRQAGGGTVAYVQNTKRKMVAEGRLPAIDRRSKKSAPTIVAAVDAQAEEVPEIRDLPKMDKSESRKKAIRAVEMIMEGTHPDIEIMKTCDLLPNEIMGYKKQVLDLQNFSQAIDHYKKLTKEGSLELHNALCKVLAERKVQAQEIPKLLDDVKRIIYWEGSLHELIDEYNQTELNLDEVRDDLKEAISKLKETRSEEEKAQKNVELLKAESARIQMKIDTDKKETFVPDEKHPAHEAMEGMSVKQMREYMIKRMTG
jgi:hypothetical protein